MSEFIGSRISLVSRSDIRYVGTLHEINSENSTVALENVKSFGTEGRKANPDEELPPSDANYEYIVFRGSDVKDLRIEEGPAPKENKPPQVPNDPAILGSGSRPTPSSQAPPPPSNQSQRGPPPQGPGPQQQGSQQQGPPPPPGVLPFGQYPPPFYPPPPAGWGRGGPPGPGFPGMSPYGGPPGWYPPPGHGFQHPGAFPPYGFPPGPPGQQFPQNAQPKPSPIGPGANKQQAPPSGPSDKPADIEQPKPSIEGNAGAPATTQPTPPAPTQQPAEAEANNPQAVAQPARAAPSGPKNGRVQPAVPLASPAAAAKLPLHSTPNNAATVAPKQTTPSSLRDATQAATAAVAAAMAKLPPVGGQQTNGNAVDNLTRKVNEMRTNDPVRVPRQPGANGFAPRGRGGRGGRAAAPSKVEVPTTDFDFESANAKFSKEDLVKEAIAGSPLGEQVPAAPADKSEVPVAYNKATSFFDNISSEAKDRTESGGSRGRGWRGKESEKNLATFGQDSVDIGYQRGGYRGGRGRGRGGFRGGRGSFSSTGQPTRGRGGYRGRGDAQAVAQ